MGESEGLKVATYRGQSPRMPDDELMMSEVATLTGGKDQSGRPIICFPSKQHQALETRVKASGLDHILRYFAQLLSPEDKLHGVAYMTDLRFSSTDFVSLLKSALNSLQAELQGVLGNGVMYAILPTNKKSQKDMMTILALRTSKKKKNKSLAVPLFQTIAVKDEGDLCRYFEQSQLTADFGGYLQYSHVAWVRFRKSVEPFFIRYDECLMQLPGALEEVVALHNYPIGETQQELEQTLRTLRKSYDDIISECNLISVSEQCNDLMQRLIRSDDDPVFADVAQKAVFQDTEGRIQDCLAQLNGVRNKLDNIWTQVEERLVHMVAAMQYGKQIEQMMSWFAREGRKLLRNAEVGETAGRTETSKIHFETALLPVAEEKISAAESLLEDVQALPASVSVQKVLDVKTQARKLTKLLKDFRKKLNQREEFLQAVCDYHVTFDEVSRWCTKVLRFLPANLDKIHDILETQSQNSHDAFLLMEWKENLKRFLRRRPGPEDGEIINFERTVKMIGDDGIRRRSLELIDRYDVLMAVMSAKIAALRSEVNQALALRDELVDPSDALESDRTSVRNPAHRRSRTNPSERFSDSTERIIDPLLQRLSLVHGGHSDAGSEGGAYPSQHVPNCVLGHNLHNRSRSSTPNRISSQQFWSGHIPDGIYDGSSGVPSQYHSYHHSSHAHPHQSLSKQHWMLSASQPHLPAQAETQMFSVYGANEHPSSNSTYYSLSRSSNKDSNTLSYIPMLSDLDQETGSQTGNQGMDRNMHMHNNQHEYVNPYMQALNRTLSTSNTHLNQGMNIQGGMDMHNSVNQPYVMGFELSPGQIPNVSGNFGHTSTPRKQGSQSMIHSSQVTHPSQHGGINRSHTPDSSQSPYSNILQDLSGLQIHNHKAASKSTPDLSRLSQMDVNFDIDPELVASELDSDEQLEYYKRVCGFLKNLPTMKRKPRRLRNRQSKQKQNNEKGLAESLNLLSDRDWDGSSVQSQSSHSYRDDSVGMDDLSENQSHHENGSRSSHHETESQISHHESGSRISHHESGSRSSHHESNSYNLDQNLKTHLAKKPSHPAHSGFHVEDVKSRQSNEAYHFTNRLDNDEAISEEHSHPVELKEPVKEYIRRISPGGQRNFIPEGTPPIAPLTDSLRRFLEDNDDTSPAGHMKQGKHWSNVLKERDEQSDLIEDLRCYEEMLSQREEDLDQHALALERDDTDIENDDLEAHEKFLKEVTEFEQEQDRREVEVQLIASQSNIRIGHADQILENLRQSYTKQQVPSLHLSDEGAVLDGISIDEGMEHGSSITTERESVESGLGMRHTHVMGGAVAI